MALEANVQIGDFRIERRLGAGGMGIVYLGRQVSLNRPVALKVLGSALTDSGQVARFRREAQAVAKLNHPGIAGVYFIGQDRELCYIAMEYIDGLSLREVIRRLAATRQPDESIAGILRLTPDNGENTEVRFDQPTPSYPPSPEPEGVPPVSDSPTPEAEQVLASAQYIRRCCEVVRDAAMAMAHAGERGVVHRDIKPENLLLDRQGKVHVIDFGLARFFEDVTLTNTGALVGTPAYMSPEQVSGHLQVDHRTDVYVLGIVLYELLTLRRAITAPTREGVLRKVVTKALPPLSRHNPASPRALEAVVHKATAKDPDERYSSADDFATDLQRYLDDKAVEAHRYRFHFDESEILYTRPKRIFVAAFVIFSIAAGCFLSVLGVFLAGPAELGRTYLEVLVLGPLFGYLSYWIGDGLVRGKKEARTTALVFCTLLTGGPLCGLILLVPRYFMLRAWDPTASFLRTGIVVCGLFLLLWLSVWRCLLKKDSREWFRFAARLRSEHQEQRSG
jgi:serine/threonine protein kinase